MSEPTPEQPEEPKGRDLTRAFRAVVRPPGEKKSLSSYLVTIGMTVVLAGAVALGVGAIVFRPHAKAKPVAAADKQRSKSLRPSGSPRILYQRPPAAPGANQPPAAAPLGKNPNGAKGDRAHGGDPAVANASPGSGGGPAQRQANVMATVATHSIVGYASHRCLDVSGGHTVNGTPVQIWNCRSDLRQQQWSFVNGTLRSMGMCMTAARSSAGTPLQVQSCNGSSAQLFRLTSANDIVHSGTNLCVDVKNKWTGAGAPLQIWTCNGHPNQKWRLA
ncbi:hypothetical protein GCM10023196_004010 [Actinoallomurus vinaceus]|uniref:Ricin B lectin domain-containing protein n=1 Tax=Actinoallomurus vinaceus TaxID=1080074 RepID=A0ABP8U3M9_9ACTN